MAKTKAPPKTVKPKGAADAPTPLEWAALEVVARKCKTQKAGHVVGDGQAVNVTLRISGSINQSGPTSANVREKASTKDLLRAVLRRVPLADRGNLAAGIINKFAAPGAKPDDVDLWVEQIIERTTVENLKPKAGVLAGAVKVEVVGRG